MVGVIYRGKKDDGGYNESHARALKALAAMPGVAVKELESVAEDEPAARAMETLATFNNAKLVFATGFGHFDPWLLDTAKRLPNTTLLHCGGYYREGLHPANAGSYFAFLDEAHYVAGFVAGLTTKKNKLGFLASRAIPHVLRSVNAFTLGARAGNAKVRTYVAFTDDWSAPAREQGEAEKLFKQGIDVLAMYVDAPDALITTAEKKGIFTVGIHTDKSALAPKGFLTGAEWNWTPIYGDYVRRVRAGEASPKIVRGGLREGYVTLSPYGAAVSQQTRLRAEDLKNKIIEGSLTIFKGPLKDDQGHVVIPTGEDLIGRDLRLEQMAYFVEGLTRLPSM